MNRVLLISNSTLHGRGYLDHAAKAQARFGALGYQLTSIHRAGDPWQAIEEAEALFVGGGNTFRLLKELHELDVVALIRRRVARGLLYIGSSAGANVAGPTIKTTKDMPIVQPPSFDALGLVPFQISPHYLDPDPHSNHMGETQEERIGRFHEEATAPVAGLREGAMVACQAADAS